MPEKLFILGVGCQKGGTTWLQLQLAEHPAINMGFTKEYHFLDFLHSPKAHARRGKKLEQLMSRELGTELSREGQQYLASFYQDRENYFNYFDDLIKRGETTRITGDITPSYCALSKELLHYTRNQFEDRDFKVKIIFVLRDPFDRIWSQIRMRRKRVLLHNPQVKFEETEQEALLSSYKDRGLRVRTRYEKTIGNLESVFSKEDIFYAFYERLFTGSCMQRLEKFLDISQLDADFEHNPNLSPKNQEIDPSVIQQIVAYYRKTYEFCDHRFKAGEVWRGYQYL